MSQKPSDLNLNKEELEQILQKYVSKSLVVKSFSSKLANEKGENYGSLLHTLDVYVYYSDSKTSETLHIMAKSAPPTEFLLVMFNFPVTFCKEMNFYKLANSTYESLEKESGIHENEMLDICPSFYGARTSLSGDEDEEAELSAVLLMGNLRALNYRTRDRLEGLDLKHTELTIIKLAEFHALPIALRQKNFKKYTENILKAASFEPNPQFDSSAQAQFANKFVEAYASQNPQLTTYYHKIKKRIIDNALNFAPVGKEPFATVVHTDLWTNNIMFSYTNPNDKNTPTKVKFIDFQGTFICSPVRDIIFFLLSSVQDYVVDNHYEDLMNLYYESFINKLKQLHSDVKQFSKENFYEEISVFAPFEFYHIALMFTVIYADRSHVKELKDVTSFDNIMHSWNTLSKYKLERTVNFFDKKGWL